METVFLSMTKSDFKDLIAETVQNKASKNKSILQVKQMSDRPTTPKQAEVYSIIRQMQLKSIVTYVLLGVFVTAFLFLIFSFFYFEERDVSIIIGSFDVLLAPTVYLMCKHYFGASCVVPTGQSSNFLIQDLNSLQDSHAGPELTSNQSLKKSSSKKGWNLK